MIQKSSDFHQNWMTKLGDVWRRMQNNSDERRDSLGVDEAPQFFENMNAVSLIGQQLLDVEQFY